MKRTKISATELARDLSDILSRVQEKGESFIVERNGHPVATLAPVDRRQRATWSDIAEALKGLPKPDDRFADDLEKIQASQEKIGPPRWDL